MSGICVDDHVHTAGSSEISSQALVRLARQICRARYSTGIRTRFTSTSSSTVVAASARESHASRDVLIIDDTPHAVKSDDPFRSVAEQLGVGGVLGFATGYSIRKLGRIVAFFVGTEICILQYLAYRKWLIMDWNRIANDVKPKLDRSFWRAGVDIVLYKLPFASAFSVGMAAGLRLSR